MNQPPLDILVGPSPHKWQTDFFADCARAGFDARLVIHRGPEESIAGLPLLLEFERLAYRIRACALDPAAPVRAEPRRRGAPAVDLTGGLAADARDLVLRPLYDGDPSLLCAYAALLDDRAPFLTVERRIAPEKPIPAQCARLAVADFSVFSRAASEYFARVRTVLLRAVQDLDRGATPVEVEAARCAAARSPLFFAARKFSGKIAHRLRKLLVTPDHWRVAWRPLRDDATLSLRRWPEAQWTILPDDGARCYADPFLFEKDGETHLFVEEYPYATQKALLSWTRLRPDGTADRPRPILETDHHLSYPFVFAHGGETYMIPESCGAGHIALYRARAFPRDWALDTILVDGVRAADATLIEHEGRFWLFASQSEPGSSSWDTLLLFYADDLRGPYRPHSRNPALVDARWARPAGAMSRTEKGAILRVAQNCIGGYGGGITICEVTRLDAENYRQEVLAQLAPPPVLKAEGVHTINSGGGWETIDFRAPLKKFGG